MANVDNTYPIADRRLLYTVELWRYWSEAHLIDIRCNLIIAAVNVHGTYIYLFNNWNKTEQYNQ